MSVFVNMQVAGEYSDRQVLLGYASKKVLVQLTYEIFQIKSSDIVKRGFR